MHPIASSFKVSILGGALAFGLVLGGAGLSHALGDAALLPAKVAPEAVAQKQKMIVHLKHGTDDLHAVSMALTLGAEMARKGAAVTLFVDLEGVRIADPRQPLGLRWGAQDRTIAQLYDNFVASGGEVLVCPHCAEAAGLRTGELRKGAKRATFEQVAETMLTADKVLDY